jgi:N-acetylmuramic acid 6-phosphate etherase
MPTTSLTEQNSNYDDLEQMSIGQIIRSINDEDKEIPLAVERSLLQIEGLVKKVVPILEDDGRLFYIGAGTSGRLGVLDASECVTTFGIAPGIIIGIIAGGDSALRTAVEGAEDSTTQGIKDLDAYNITAKDFVLGIAASGRTPYVAHALKDCQERKISTGCIVCSPDSFVRSFADYPIEILVGPEFVTGSTRMKAGTAQKLVLNMVSTAAMIKLGRVEGNKMTHMFLSNSKLMDRGIRIVMEKTGLSYEESAALLESCNNRIQPALDKFRGQDSPSQ